VLISKGFQDLFSPPVVGSGTILPGILKLKSNNEDLGLTV
jgi:hypothetical protein